MGKQIIYEYIKQTADNLTSIVRRQTWKVWDYGDAIVYLQPGGKMHVYHFLERGANSEVMEEAPIGWCPPAAPAFVYDMEIGLTNNHNTVVIGEYIRSKKDTNNTIETQPVLVQQQQQRPPRNPHHTNQFKKKSVQPQQHQQSIPLSLHASPAKRQERANKGALPLMSIPLCG